MRVLLCGESWVTHSDPLVACGRYHAGRSAVFTSDCAPHWAPPAFMEWPGYRAPVAEPDPLAGRR
jgi:uncharacterized membrane protein